MTFRPGDIVLVKGSRSGMRRQIAEALAGQEVTAWGGWNDDKENTPT
ncbi:hypothetical protein ACWDD9_31405 [Kitasatospora sp. NPDC001119]